MKNLGQFTRIKTPFTLEVKLDTLETGINSLKDYIIRVKDNGEIDYIVSKTCDHAGGKLIVKKQNAICPLHGWELDLNSLEYNNSHIKKEKIPYLIKDNVLYIETNSVVLVNEIQSVQKTNNILFQWHNHACVHFAYNNKTLITDPWLFGPAFLGGWWLQYPSRQSAIDNLLKSDFVYISHNHPDHLHPETLQLISKEKIILVPNFKSGATKKYLVSLGFTNIIELDFNHLYDLGNEFIVSILKSGDFRDDSGLYLKLGDKEFLLTVDANFLNSGVLPENIDVLMTSFAAGATGFPIIYNNFTQTEKSKILLRNRNAHKAGVLDYLNKTKPKYYHPYAGMFEERAPRDVEIKELNVKNDPNDFKAICNAQNVEFLTPNNKVIYQFLNNDLLEIEDLSCQLVQEEVETYITSFKKFNELNLQRVSDYMSRSNYVDTQIVNLIPCDSKFKEEDEFVCCNFHNQTFEIKSIDEIQHKHESYRTMSIWIRSEILMMVINNKMPWEDFSIGFQARITRYPNTYESEFWYHFTNNYINDKYFKFNQYCGACKLIEQNPKLI